MRLSINKTIYIIIFMSCLGLCLYQTFKLCELYFSYKTIVSMSYQKESIISLPAISVCIRKSLLIRDEYLETIFANKSHINRSNELYILQYLNTKTIRRQIKALYNTKHNY